MKRFASLVGTAALAAALLLPGKPSLATTTYAMYLQPISPTTMQAGPNAVFTFRALIDVPALDASNNATISLTLGPAVTYTTAVTGPTPVAGGGVITNRGKFKFVPDTSPFAPLVALGVTDALLWQSPPPAPSFSTAVNGTLTYQGAVGHYKEIDFNTGASLFIPAGTYTIGTYTIPIRYAGNGYMDIVLPGSIGLTGGPNGARDFINNTSSQASGNVFTNDGVLTYPNDGVTHFSTIHLTLANDNSTYLTGRIAFEGMDNLANGNSHVPLGPVTMDFRAPGTTTALFSTTLTLSPDAILPRFGNYSIPNVTPGTYDIAIKDKKHLRVVVPNVVLNGSRSLPDVILPGGDANNDNVVDIGDFGVLVNAFGNSGAP